jgi:hypothetical protein
MLESTFPFPSLPALNLPVASLRCGCPLVCSCSALIREKAARTLTQHNGRLSDVLSFGVILRKQITESGSDALMNRIIKSMLRSYTAGREPENSTGADISLRRQARTPSRMEKPISMTGRALPEADSTGAGLHWRLHRQPSA